MKSVFALIAAAAIVASAQVSFAASCPNMVKSGRNGTYEPTSSVKSVTVKTVKAVK